MDLFVAAGIDLNDGARSRGRSGRMPARLLRVPLLNHRVVEQARQRTAFDPTGRQLAAASDYARKARSPKFARQNETAIRQSFFEQVLGTVLGYRTYDPESPYTLAFERAIRRGTVDVALGSFPDAEGIDRIVAPFELKGPAIGDLDAIMPGRGISPVQQAWNYAIDAPGTRWVLVSNCLEIRLYGFGRGRDAYELFDLTKLDDREEHTRLWLLLSSERFLGGATDALLGETDSAYKEITNDLYKEYNELRKRLIGFLVDSADGPKIAPLDAIETAQKLLDRILFIAFAQGTALLPERILERTAAARNFILPEPVWRNFLALFRFIDHGEPRHYIHAYNGGLFASDPVADNVILPDDLAEDVVKLGQWDYGNDVSVTVLGHIFEQSITDLEKLRAESLGQPAPKVTKRKREGVVYTPDIVTRFLAERTIGVTLAERFADLLRQHAEDGAVPKNGDPIRWRQGEASEQSFWRDYSAALRDLRIVDPACGSGAFLVAAFDLLAAEYSRVTERLAELGENVEFDPFDEIVTRNLHGVDLNAESVEITRLALWLKTARRHHRLQNLEATIKVGNSLIDDPAFTERPFDWHAAFPEVFARGGFDVVIGNPPYVRSETISAIKPYLKANYDIFDSAADLYCYFYEAAFRILKEGGRLGFISSSGFFKATFGHRLRAYLAENATLESGIDFGDVRVFEDVTTYPAVLTLAKHRAEAPYQFDFLSYSGTRNDDVSGHFETGSFPFPSDRLGRARWHFEPDQLWRLRDHVESASPWQLSDIAIPVSGIKTGLTDAFVLSDETRERLISSDSSSAEVIRQWMTGDDIARWQPEKSHRHLIFLPKGWTKALLGEDEEVRAWSKLRALYPAIAAWLHSFEPKARSRSDQGDFWWELRPCDYYQLFDEEIIIYPEMSQGPKFGMKSPGSVSNNKTFLLPDAEYSVLAYLNSRACWFLLSGICTALRGGIWRLELRADFLRDLPLPSLAGGPKAELAKLGARCCELSQRNDNTKGAVRRRLLDLATSDGPHRLTRKLHNWWELDFPAFRAEVKRAFRSEIAVKERADWESYLAENAAEVRSLTDAIEKAERDIDAIVYRLFDLTDDEVKLLESSIQGQH